MTTESNVLIEKIKQFQRFSAKKRLLKGVVLFFTFNLGLVVSLVVLEYIGNFNSILRAIFFYGSVVFFLWASWRYIIRHALEFWGLRKGMSLEDTSRYIGTNLREVGDQLTNALQLSKEGSDLALRSITDKQVQLQRIDFREALQRERLLRYYLSFILILAGFGTIWQVFPDVWESGSRRIIEYAVPYHEMAPFDVTILSDPKEVIENNYAIRFRFDGSAIPQEAKLLLDGQEFQASRKADVFEVQVQPLDLTGSFRIEAGKYAFGPFSLDLRKKPAFNVEHVRVEYPAYLGLEPDSFGYARYIEVPEGSQISFFVSTSENASLWLQARDGGEREEAREVDWEITHDRVYDAVLGNSYWSEQVIDSASIGVIRDEHPKIQMTWEEELRGKDRFINFELNAQDDHGLKDLALEVTEEGASPSEGWQVIKEMTNEAEGSATYRLKMSTLDKVDRFRFRVRDNDVRNGYKAAYSSFIQVEELRQENQKSALNKLRSEAVAWEESERKKEEVSPDAEAVSEEEKRLENAEKVLQELERDLSLEEKNQQRISELEKLLEELVKEQKEQPRKKETNTSQKKELNARMQELVENWLKELYKEEKLSELANQLEEVAEGDKLDDSSKNEERVADQDSGEQVDGEEETEAEKEQSGEESEQEKSTEQDLQKDYEQWKEEWNKYDSTLGDWEMEDEDQEEFDREADGIEENLKDQNSDSSEGEKKEQEQRERMKELSKQMQRALQDSQKEAYEENYQNIRMLHENVLALSFQEEVLYDQGIQMQQSDPGWKKLRVEQSDILEDWEVVKDSLFALGERVDLLLSVIREGVVKVERNSGSARSALSESDNPKLQTSTRGMMTGFNDLALLLDQAMQQMQMQMQSMSQSDGQCEKPGNSQGKGKGKKQSKMKKALQELQRGMKEKQGKPEKGKTGEKGQEGSQGNREEMQMMRAAGELRQLLRSLEDEEGDKNGSGGLKELEQELDRIESDILEDKISKATERRLEQLEVKMLEWETAQREQDEEERREAQSGDLYQQIREREMNEYLERSRKERELQRWRLPQLDRYYRKKGEQYSINPVEE